MKISIAVSLFFLSLSAFADFDLENSYIAHIEKQIDSNCSHSQEILDTTTKEFKDSSVRSLWDSYRVSCTEGQKPILYMELLLMPQNAKDLQQVEDYLKARNGKTVLGVRVIFEKFQISYGVQKFSAHGFQGESAVDYQKRVAYSDFDSMLEENSKLTQTFQYGAIGDAIRLVSGLFSQPLEIIEKNWNQTNYRLLTVHVAVRTGSQEFVSSMISYRFGVYAERNWE